MTIHIPLRSQFARRAALGLLLIIGGSLLAVYIFSREHAADALISTCVAGGILGALVQFKILALHFECEKCGGSALFAIAYVEGPVGQGNQPVIECADCEETTVL